MTRAVGIALIMLSACVVSSCATSVDGIWVSGRANDVSPEDIRAAIAADIRAHPAIIRSSRPRQIEVVSKDEIHLYWPQRNVYGGSDIIKRERGGWKYYGQVIVTE